jgi:PAS domain S-box-containing protein
VAASLGKGAKVSDELDTIIEAVLRGAAKILGCTSATLIVFDEVARHVRLRVGAVSESADPLGEAEGIIGELTSLTCSFEQVADSCVFASWRDRTPLETPSLVELVGSAMPRDAVEPVQRMIGDYRFACIPALAGSRCYGIIVFTKPGRHPFSAQQRELHLRYARRIADIIENGLRDVGSRFVGLHDRPLPLVVGRAVIDPDGTVSGISPAGTGLPANLPPGAIARVAERARVWLATPVPDGARDLVDLEDAAQDLPREERCGLAAELERLQIGGRTCALATLLEVRPRTGPGGFQLLHLALGEAAPSILVDPDFSITSWNDAARRLFAWPADEIAGVPVGALFSNPEDIRAILDRQFLMVASGWFEEATVLRRHDGSLFPAKIEALLLSDHEDRTIGFLVLVRDRTTAGGDRDAIDRLMRQERLANMGELAAQLAHELRNPLVAIGATLEGVQADLEEGRDVREIVRDVRSEVDRMDTILRDYLSMAARRDRSIGHVDLATGVDDAIRLLAASRRAAGVTVSSDIPPDTAILGDPDGLRHVFFNLLVNAAEAMTSGGSIRCSAAVGPEDVTLHFDDTGPGLACDERECFEPFFTTKKQGTGLGLAVCQKIAEAHGGAVTLTNRVEGGCRASVALPRNRTV